MDRPGSVIGSDDVDAGIPAKLKHPADEELKTALWDSPTCQRCLSCFHPELAGPVQNESQALATHIPVDGVVLHSEPADLADGLLEGCWWCTRLFSDIQTQCGTASIEDFSQRYPNFHSAIREYCIVYHLDDENHTLAFHRHDWTRSSGGYLLDNNQGYARSHQIPAKHLPSCMYQLDAPNNSTGSHRSMQYIRTQVHNCRDTHEVCGRSSDSTWYPRRLLQILSTGDGDITALRLVETRDDKTVKGPYATLSYCWGGKLNLRLLTGSYEKYRNAGIPADKIPQLFLDAAYVALNLGANYIWIDALCIIQDSTNDWLQESATMHRVYENGLCNIMAGSAAHSGEPLFRKRDTRLVTPCIVHGSDPRKISTYHEDQSADVLESERWFAILRLLPLYQRGWILQERLLTTRSILFTRDNIYFQCTHGTTRDVFPKNNIFEYGFKLSNIGPKSFTYENCFQKWRGIVTAYGYTTLSEQRDTLIAVSGLAEKIKQLHPSRYLHGLWEADLVKGLSWTDIGHERRLGFSAPSWSWASVRRPYYIAAEGAGDGNYEIPKVLATASEDQLRLRAPMFSIGAHAPSSTYDSTRIEEAIRQHMGSLSGPGSPPTVYLDGSDVEREERPLPGMLLCLPLLYSRETRHCTGLLLVPVTAAWGVYRRIGLFQIRFEDRGELPSPDSSGLSAPEVREGPEGHPESLLALCTSGPEDIHHHEYDEVRQEHTVVLV